MSQNFALHMYSEESYRIVLTELVTAVRPKKGQAKIKCSVVSDPIKFRGSLY